MPPANAQITIAPCADAGGGPPQPQTADQEPRGRGSHGSHGSPNEAARHHESRSSVSGRRWRSTTAANDTSKPGDTEHALAREQVTRITSSTGAEKGFSGTDCRPPHAHPWGETAWGASDRSHRSPERTPDAVAEVKVITNNESAEYGHSAGATMNVAFRSGTNQLHGGAWEGFRNTALNSSTYVAPPGG